MSSPAEGPLSFSQGEPDRISPTVGDRGNIQTSHISPCVSNTATDTAVASCADRSHCKPVELVRDEPSLPTRTTSGSDAPLSCSSSIHSNRASLFTDLKAYVFNTCLTRTRNYLRKLQTSVLVHIEPQFQMLQDSVRCPQHLCRRHLPAIQKSSAKLTISVQSRQACLNCFQPSMNRRM